MQALSAVSLDPITMTTPDMGDWLGLVTERLRESDVPRFLWPTLQALAEIGGVGQLDCDIQPGWARIAGMSGCSLRTVARHMVKFDDMGLIKCTRRRGRNAPSWYQVQLSTLGRGETVPAFALETPAGGNPDDEKLTGEIDQKPADSIAGIDDESRPATMADLISPPYKNAGTQAEEYISKSFSLSSDPRTEEKRKELYISTPDVVSPQIPTEEPTACELYDFKRPCEHMAEAKVAIGAVFGRKKVAGNNHINRFIHEHSVELAVKMAEHLKAGKNDLGFILRAAFTPELAAGWLEMYGDDALAATTPPHVTSPSDPLPPGCDHPAEQMEWNAAGDVRCGLCLEMIDEDSPEAQWAQYEALLDGQKAIVRDLAEKTLKKRDPAQHKYVMSLKPNDATLDRYLSKDILAILGHMSLGPPGWDEN